MNAHIKNLISRLESVSEDPMHAYHSEISKNLLAETIEALKVKAFAPQPPVDTIRVLRIYEFVGPRDEVERQVAMSIQGEKSFGTKAVIRAATLGTFPEILEPATAPRDELTLLEQKIEGARKYVSRHLYNKDGTFSDGYDQALASMLQEIKNLREEQ